MRKSVFILLVLFHFTFSHAGDATGTIGDLYVHGYNDGVYFRLESDSLNFTECANSNRYGVMTDTVKGKNIYSSVLAAKLAGKTVYIRGSNNCDVGSGSEGISFLVIK